MRLSLLPVVLLLLSAPLTAQFTDLEARIDSLVPPLVHDGTPGLVVGVVQNGELVFGKGYGLANLAYGIPNDPEMVYNIGSVTKQFLGYAFAMLHVADSLDLDDPVGKYLDDWPEFDEPVTLRHLLTHTSGYREAYTMSELAGRAVGVDRLSREESLTVVRRQSKLEFRPGSRYTYNSTAWVILAEVLAEVTGEPADEWVTENVLQPLGMDASQIESYVGEPIRNAAESYNYVPTLGYVNEHSNRALFGGADLYVNLPDLAKWIDNYKTAVLGGPEVNALFLDPYTLTDGTNSEYGLGIQINEYRGLRRYRHTGGHEAFVTQLSYYPEQDVGIIVISNSGGQSAVPSMDIADRVLADVLEPVTEKPANQMPKSDTETPGWEPTTDILAEYTGDYYSEELETVYHLVVEEGRLLVRHRWLGDVRLRAVTEDAFAAAGFEVRFERNAEAKVSGFAINSGRTLGVWFERTE
ncbi:MAG: serine hydrolase domain-containing protein [Lewinella sp.]